MKKTLIFAAIYLLPLVAFAADNSNNFVPLTSVLGQNITNTINSSGDFSTLVNNIYKICIGAAALIAVFQIARAGLLYMSAGDSEESISNARHLITNSILGLVLVLSPYIVFGIINPDILNLKIGTANGGSLSQLTDLPSGTPGASGSGTGTTGTAGATGSGSTAGTQTPAQQQYSTTPGSYIWVIGGHDKNNPDCTTLYAFGTNDQNSCQTNAATALKSIESSNGSGALDNITTYYNCVQTSDGSFSVPSTGLCATQQHLFQ